MNELVMNIPTLRFTEFEGEWELKKLGDVAIINRGKSKHRPRDAAFLYGGKYPFIQTGDIKNASLYLTEFTQTYSEDGLKQSKLWDENTLCITIAANIAETAILKIKACFPDSIIGLIPYEDKTTPLFVKYQFDKFKIQIQLLSQGVAQDNLNQEKLSNIEFSFPTLVEQKKIAGFLSAVDEKLQQLKQKKTLLEQYKKGVMQQIFNQEIRFKDDDGNEYPDWEEKSLGDICEIARSGGTPTSTKKEYYNGDIPFLSISDMTTQGKYLNFTSNHISKFGLENSSSWIVPANSIIYSMYASVGFVAINKIPMATSQAVLNLILKDYVSTEFIYYTLVDFQKKLAKFITTGTQGNLNAQTVKDFELTLPSISEQTKIANFLSAIDENINNINHQLTLTEQWKKGLLQKMFV